MGGSGSLDGGGINGDNGAIAVADKCIVESSSLKAGVPVVDGVDGRV